MEFGFYIKKSNNTVVHKIQIRNRFVNYILNRNYTVDFSVEHQLSYCRIKSDHMKFLKYPHQIGPVILFLANVNSCSRSLYADARPSVGLTLVRRTQPVEFFG